MTIDAMQQSLRAIAIRLALSHEELTETDKNLNQIRESLAEAIHFMGVHEQVLDTLQLAMETLKLALAHMPTEAQSPTPGLLPPRKPRAQIESVLATIETELDQHRC